MPASPSTPSERRRFQPSRKPEPKSPGNCALILPVTLPGALVPGAGGWFLAVVGFLVEGGGVSAVVAAAGSDRGTSRRPVFGGGLAGRLVICVVGMRSSPRTGCFRVTLVAPRLMISPLSLSPLRRMMVSAPAATSDGPQRPQRKRNRITRPRRVLFMNFRPLRNIATLPS